MQEKILDLGWSVLPHPPYLPDFTQSNFSIKYSDNFPRRLGENVWRKLLALKSSWILRGINKLPYKCQVVIQNNGELIEINLLLNYSWINYILLKQIIYDSTWYIYIYIYIYIYMEVNNGLLSNNM